MYCIYFVVSLFLCSQLIAIENANVDHVYQNTVDNIISILNDLAPNSQTAKGILDLLNNSKLELNKQFGNNNDRSANLKKIVYSCKRSANKIKQLCNNVVKQNTKKITTLTIQEINDMFSKI